MTPLDLAHLYLEIFFSGDDYDRLAEIFHEDLSFCGPFTQCATAVEYIDSLKEAPLKEAGYQIINEYETESEACVIYRFNKPGVSTRMAQTFEVESDKIKKILLIFDTGAFAE